MKNGFTLIEILVAVLIMGILVAMAVPTYEKAIEKSRIAEARTMLKRIYDSKTRLMDSSDSIVYSTALFGFENLDYTFPCVGGATTENDHQIACSSEDFRYVLLPAGVGNENLVCAVRRGGDNQGVNFLYRGESVSGTDEKFLCNDGGVEGASCEAFGMDSTGDAAFCTL
ncbi:MAG: prepilin-type N-terminal cleavage/methylation domain-containing protein [Elusimicrobiaceae bacterium]|nr:prepilin-type N-terminal cleavage/methylation domain-containing protein [Elusimicrobiaceae bacterium]